MVKTESPAPEPSTMPVKADGGSKQADGTKPAVSPAPYKNPNVNMFGIDLKTRWESPFSKWTEEDWKTRKFPTKAELKAAIPEHCFERSALKGFGYIARDILVVIAGLYIFKTLGLSAELPETAAGYPVWILSWVFYGLAQGGLAGGLWVMGHECGHGAFSEYGWLNDLVGWVLHSFFLVPYFAWQFSHAKHHRRTNDLIEGETHVPETMDDAACSIRYRIYQVLGTHGFAIFDIFYHVVLLFPVYFFGLASGGRLDAESKPIEKGTWMDHYRPTSRLFPTKMRTKVVLSDLGLIIMLSILLNLSLTYGFLPVILWYGMANWGMNNGFLVFVTWMQHTHPSIPHFGESDWTWVKGAIVGTVDRPDPFIDFFGHYIGSTHVCHHLFHEIPFYNAIEATAALKAFLEPKGMYNFDPTYQLKSMYLASKHCHYVESVEGVQYYRSFKDLKKSKVEKKNE